MNTVISVWWNTLKVLTFCELITTLILFFIIPPSLTSICGLIYVSGCAFRAFFPRLDIERICLVDSPASAIFYGRAAATLAEISFGLQITLMLDSLGSIFAPLAVLISVISNIFCWQAVLSRNNLFHIYEEIGWAMIGIICETTFLILYIETGSYADLLSYTIAVIYVSFMVCADIPLYMRKYKHDSEIEAKYLSWSDGVINSFTYIVHREYEIWRHEMTWMSGYFIFGSMISILMMIYY